MKVALFDVTVAVAFVVACVHAIENDVLGAFAAAFVGEVVLAHALIARRS